MSNDPADLFEMMRIPEFQPSMAGPHAHLQPGEGFAPHSTPCQDRSKSGVVPRILRGEIFKTQNGGHSQNGFHQSNPTGSKHSSFGGDLCEIGGPLGIWAPKCFGSSLRMFTREGFFKNKNGGHVQYGFFERNPNLKSIGQTVRPITPPGTVAVGI